MKLLGYASLAVVSSPQLHGALAAEHFNGAVAIFADVEPKRTAEAAMHIGLVKLGINKRDQGRIMGVFREALTAAQAA